MPLEDRPEPVTAAEAGKRLDRRAASTIRWWAKRYNAVQLNRWGRAVYYDMRDLRVIEREISHGHEVPATPEERAAIAHRCPLREAERSAAA
ncbi:hypothetical protein GCM10023085_45640 [Actinomadura viridis]|uniref:Uncharacterized protein n=1 Tax=Actinomadura viridis TaxID=58110 RepID=A0A931DF18_9ACTN|nr:hypothetical protein [Actinomadura viridis]MBG6089924.1 hypothetical protein [Actinomadura viridis]